LNECKRGNLEENLWNIGCLQNWVNEKILIRKLGVCMSGNLKENWMNVSVEILKKICGILGVCKIEWMKKYW
jgi:hypothetical protein